jgi:hypothetical protein
MPGFDGRIAVGDGPFSVDVLQIVTGRGEASPLYRIIGPAPIGGAIVESNEERAVEIAAALNALVAVPESLARHFDDVADGRRMTAESFEQCEWAFEETSAARELQRTAEGIASMLRRGRVAP